MKANYLNYFKSPVGGIIYKPITPQKELDIYGEEIDLPSLITDLHRPIAVKSNPVGYQQRYTINPPVNTSDNEESKGTGQIILQSSWDDVKSQHKIESGVDVGNMQNFLNEAAKHGVYFRVTSGLRPGATTSSGKTSWHSSGDALDITPIDGQTWDDLKSQFRNNPELIAWMQNNGYGILDETTEEMLAKTGGTGAHFHIGKDNIALEGLKQFIV